MKFFSYENPEQDIVEAPAPVVAARPVLREFSDADLDVLHNFLSELRFTTGAPLVTAGSAGDGLYIIISGLVSVRLPDGKEIEKLGEGELFGIASFLDGEPNPAAVTALGNVGVMVLRRDAFEQLAAWKPPLAVALLQDLAAFLSRRQRLNQTAF